ncbi:MAG: GNAT family N-acetyltransferase [Pseudomonadota bacterium]
MSPEDMRAGEAIVAPTPVLQTERLVLTRPVPDEAEPWIAFRLSPRAVYAGGRSPDRRDAWRRFASQLGHWQIRGFGLWSVREKGSDRLLGGVGCNRPEGWPEPEIGWLLFEGAEGRGIATEAAAAARADAYARLGWAGCVSYIDPANRRSIAVAERLGCTLDPDAEKPDTDPCLVFRHPSPAALAS